ncbi:MAG: polysaccharide deacetylase family protein [Victivallaceae bacterium]|nr:polysaccharide deacetylase family protein [Victivallaceae bacterium]
MNKILLSFDVEEFDIPREYGAEVSEQDEIAVSAAGLEPVLDLLEAKKVTATFFVTAVFAERAPGLFARIVSGGHEIASHGLRHTGFEIGDLAESKRILERLSGCRVTGFRAARLAPVPAEEIGRYYDYDSSLNPTFLPGRYNNLNKPATVFREPCGLLRCPVSVTPLARFPLFWLSFKNLPLGPYCLLAGAALSHYGFFSLYTHPWEYNAAIRDPRWKLPKYIVRHAGGEQLDRLGVLIDRLGSKGEFTTFNSYLREF